MDKFMNENSRSKKLINVYNHLQDDESRMIYEFRSLYSLTDDKVYMRNIVRNSALSKCLIECINVNKNKKLVLFGAGTWGKAITNYLDDIHWDYVIDNNKKGTQINGYSISSLDDLQDKCNVIEKGCWSENTQIGFDCAGEGSSIVENSACTSVIETTSIDEILDGGEATYIKMDIEGAEYEALLGAKNTIKKYKPKCAISIYHKRCDIWEIPILLLSYNPDYKFYLRTYSFSGNDTVLYAL